MGIEDFTAPLIDPFQSALGPLQDLISGHRSNHDDLRNLVNSLVSSASQGTGDLFTGLTATAVKDSTERLIQMSEQRMQALEQMVSGFSNAANSASNAVGNVVSAFLPTDLLDKVLQNMDLVSVIMEGESVVSMAINALLQTFLQELDNPFSFLKDLAEGAIEVLTGVMPATLVPWGAEVFQLVQEVIQVINMIQTLLSTLQSLSTPIQELFSEIGQEVAPSFGGDLGAIFGAIAAIELGVVSVTQKNLSTVGETAGAQATQTLNQGPTGQPNQIGTQPSGIPGLGGKMDQYAEIIVNTPQGQQEVIVPIHNDTVQIVIGGTPQGGQPGMGGVGGSQVTITITSNPPTASAPPMSGGVGGSGPLLGGGQIGATQPIMNTPHSIPIGNFQMGGGGSSLGYGGNLPPMGIQGTNQVLSQGGFPWGGNGGFQGDLHAVGAQFVAGNTVQINQASMATGAALAQTRGISNIRTDGSGEYFGMPPMMGMGGGYVGGATTSDDDN